MTGVERWEGDPPDADHVDRRLRAEGLSPSRWGNGPGATYGWHRHGYHKVLYCVAGGITFHVDEVGDLALGPGDRLDLDAGTGHAATVGGAGVTCTEAPRRP